VGGEFLLLSVDLVVELEPEREGLINQACTEEDLNTVVAAYTSDLMLGGPEALAATKKLARQIPRMLPADAYALLAELSAERFQSPEGQEGITAFREKRPAAWVR
jgi:methylglutaconyl-CoA hydratase